MRRGGHPKSGRTATGVWNAAPNHALMRQISCDTSTNTFDGWITHRQIARLDLDGWWPSELSCTCQYRRRNYEPPHQPHLCLDVSTEFAYLPKMAAAPVAVN